MNEPKEIAGLHDDEKLTIGGVHNGIGWMEIGKGDTASPFHFADADSALDVAQLIIGVAREMQRQQAGRTE